MDKIRRIFSLMAVCLLSCFVFPFYEISAFAYVTLEAEIPVTCLEIPDGKTHIYQIIIESENDTSPVPRSEILEITENGTGKFEIDIDEPGTFVYRVFEKDGGEPNVKYDDNVYSVTVFVESVSDSELKYAVSAEIAGKDGKPDKIVFENSTDGDTEIVPTIPDTPVHPNMPPTDTVDPPSGGESDEPDTPESDQVPPKVTTAAADEPSPDKNDDTNNPITGFIENVLTGDGFPAHAIRLIMLSSIVIAISTLLFKRDSSEVEEKNEE